MSFTCRSGTFTSIATTGSQSISGVGFQPKALIIFYSATSGEDAYNADARYGMGLTDGTNTVSATSMMVNNLSTKTDRQKNLSLICVTTGSVVTLAVATLTTLDSDGFTINWTTNTVARDYHYLALGGSDLTNAKAGSFAGTLSTGSFPVTGVGFKPDFVIFMSPVSGAVAPHAAAYFNVGFASSSTNRGTFGATSNTAATRRTWQYQRNVKCMAEVQLSTTLYSEADFTSFDADGFTINFSTVPASGASTFYYLALKGGKYTVGSFNANTTTGNQAVSGLGFAPVGIFLASFDNVSVTTVQSNNRLTMGAADKFSGTGQHAFGCNDTDNIVSGQSSKRDSKTHVFEAVTTTSTAAQTLEMEATVNSWDTDGYTLNWGTNTATLGAIEILYVAFGNTPLNRTVFVEWEES